MRSMVWVDAEASARRVAKKLRKRGIRVDPGRFANAAYSLSHDVRSSSVFRVMLFSRIGDPASPLHWSKVRCPVGALKSYRDIAKQCSSVLP